MHVEPQTDRDAVEALDGVHLTQLAVGDEMSIQHFRIEPGANVPEHSHVHEQLGYLFTGTLTFLVEGEAVPISADDSYALVSEEPHGVENRGEEVVTGIDVFSPPRANPDWAE